ncbi:hypothetical protein OSB04_011910 [Centaurea solstitialis]|uniref:Gag-pol polyprotein n=1 Tax=Centaurea solstitialis TaxID=347529 RepID=A0AA38TNF6_9ASTR|nr:hypothetical protein OSB04_011910 [Centaurea solstitialis]
MTGSKSVLSNYREERGPAVTFGGNGLMHNLLSISQLCDKNHKVSFSKKKCKVKNRRKEVILTGVRQADIYIINMNTSTDNFCFVSRASTDTNWLWHKRLSHLNFKTLNQLCINNLVVGLPDFRYTKISSISSPLQLLHMDLFGPVNVQSIAGKKYTLVIVDEYYRYIWVFFLRSKSDAPEEIILFVRKMERLNNLTVRSIRIDHGTEFKNSTLETFFDQKGISQNFSSVRTPQQNGVAERRNRTLIEAARSMLSEANLATQFWVEAVNTACYTQNRSLIVKRFRRTPYELFRNRKPSNEHLHIFGCVCYILNNKDNLGKFDSKSDDGIFLGYSSISKTYRVFNKRRQTIQETIHVKFDESGPTFPHPHNNSDINQWADSFFQFPDIPIADPSPQDLPDSFEESPPPPPSQISIPPIINATPITQVTPEPDQPTNCEDFSQTTVSEPAPTNLLPDPSVNEASTSGQVYQPPALRWTKDHPIDQVLGNPSSGVKTRRQSGNVCLYVNFISENEPKEIDDALRDSAWVSAMQEELVEFIRNNVWLLVPRPRKRTIIGSKWIFRNKLDEIGTIIRNKARLVAQGYRQEEGIDYVTPRSHSWQVPHPRIRGRHLLDARKDSVQDIMVTTRRTGTGERPNDGDEHEIPDLRGIIAAEVGEVLHDLLPGLFEQMKRELTQVVTQQVNSAMAGRGSVAGSSSTGQNRAVGFKDFAACQPPHFGGDKDPIVASRWISEVEGAFLTSFCPAEVKVRYAANLLRGPAKDWWGVVNSSRTQEQIGALTWEAFLEMFRAEFVPQIEVERLTTEFLEMEQTTESVTEITNKFLEQALFCREYVQNERMKMYRYRNILRSDIREFVVMAHCDSFQQMFEKARTRELELERQGKKKRAERVQPQQQVVKKFKTGIQKGDVKKDYPRCSRCGKNHLGECRMGSGTCYKCGKPGHISRDCKVEPKMCFKCFRPGHFANECPTAAVSTEISGSAPVKAIEGGPSKKVEAPRTRARVFQLTANEAKAEPDVVTGIFLVNSMPALVLFDTGASKSFVSLSFCKDFMNVKSKLESPLEVEIADEEFRLCKFIYKKNVLEVEGVKFSIDLIPIPMREIQVVAGMDWLRRNGANVDCENCRVVV